MIPITVAARRYGIPYQTILALGRRGLVKTVDYWRSPGGALRRTWAHGFFRGWHVREKDLQRLHTSRRQADYVTAKISNGKYFMLVNPSSFLIGGN